MHVIMIEMDENDNFHFKLITFYEYLMILIHQDYNFRKNEISINFLDF